MFCFYILFLLGLTTASHYRGGSISWTIRTIPENISDITEIPVRITQRHSWRRSVHFCNNTSSDSGDLIGSGSLIVSSETNDSLAFSNLTISATVKCTDFNQEFDYSSGEISTTVLLPVNEQIVYIYASCCWVPVLLPDVNDDWSMKLLINTSRRLDGKLNNSPRTAMNPIVQVQLGKVHLINIPMADSDGDPIQCRWGQTVTECGGICAPKGLLNSNPCQLTYNASNLGYQAVAIIIEDFDSNHNVLSAIPLQFLIHIVNTIDTENNNTCTEPPVYIGDWAPNACIGVQSNTTMNARIQIRIPCVNTSTVVENILTVSPAGLNKGEIIRDTLDPNLYSMSVDWTPQPDQYGIQQLCLTPVDSQKQTGSQVCLTFQVDMSSPEFVLLAPSDTVTSTHTTWTIMVDRDIVRPTESEGKYIRFFRQSNNQEVYRINVVSDVTIVYEPRQITFFTTGYTWEENESYYILVDSGVAKINESCGIESASINDPQIWTFHILSIQTTIVEEAITMENTVSINIPLITSTTQLNPTSRATCPRWVSFNTISNETTTANELSFTFCFTVDSTSADVVISANTWVSCMLWKSSGAADPLLELYSESNGELLAQNDDGNNFPFKNCYAAVLSYRLPRGDYRVVIRSLKCAYGKFELRLIAETNRHVK